MDKNNILRSQLTKQLLFWHERAVTSGGNKYTYFDGRNSRTLTFTESEIAKELNTREDNPKLQLKKKTK